MLPCYWSIGLTFFFFFPFTECFLNLSNSVDLMLNQVVTCRLVERSQLIEKREERRRSDPNYDSDYDWDTDDEADRPESTPSTYGLKSNAVTRKETTASVSKAQPPPPPPKRGPPPPPVRGTASPMRMVGNDLL